MAMEKILILCFSNIKRDPRVSRQIVALSKKYTVTVAGFSGTNHSETEFISLDGFSKSNSRKALKGWHLLSNQFEKHYWKLPPVTSAIKQLSHRKFDLIIANDIDTLPVAIQIANGSPVHFDAHEYSPRQFEDSLYWRIFYQSYNTYLCEKYIKFAHSISTVSKGIADEYKKTFNVTPGVIMNTPARQNLTPSHNESARIRIIHHGAAIRSRRIELMIEAFQHLDKRFELDLMLIPSDQSYYRNLEKLARKYKKVKFLPTVPMPEIPKFINDYDIGMYILEPNSFNMAHALPNKIFEFIQAGLAVAISPSPEMASIVKEYNVGIIANDFSSKSMAEALNSLTDKEISKFKESSHTASKTLCFECEAEKLINTIEKSLKNNSEYYNS